MALIYTLVILFLIVCESFIAHPTIYPHMIMKRAKRDLKHTLPNPPPGIISYHIHITYTLFNPPVRINLRSSLSSEDDSHRYRYVIR